MLCFIRMYSANTAGIFFFIAAQRWVRKRVKHHNKKGFLSRSFAYFALNLKTSRECLWSTEKKRSSSSSPNTGYDGMNPMMCYICYLTLTQNPPITRPVPLFIYGKLFASHLLAFHFKSDAAAEIITREMSKFCFISFTSPEFRHLHFDLFNLNCSWPSLVQHR